MRFHCANCKRHCTKAQVCQDCRLQIYCGEQCRLDHLGDHISLCTDKIWEPKHLKELSDEMPRNHPIQKHIDAYLKSEEEADLRQVQKHVASMLSTPEPVGGAIFRARLWVMRKFKKGRDDILANVKTNPDNPELGGVWSKDREKLLDVLRMADKEKVQARTRNKRKEYRAIYDAALQSLAYLRGESKEEAEAEI